MNGQKLQELRKKKRLSQQALAEMTGLNRATISKMESNPAYVTTIETAMKIADALGISWKSLF